MKIAYLAVLLLFGLLTGCNEESSDIQTTAPAVTDTSEAEVSENELPEQIQVTEGQLTILDISTEQYQGRPALVVVLSARVDADQKLDKWLQVEDQKGQRVKGSWIVADSLKRLYFTAVEPEKSYQVMVGKDLPGKQSKLTSSRQAEVQVAAVNTMLGFAGNGNLLAKDLAKGLPVIAANVSRVDVDFYRLPNSRLVSFLSQNSRKGQLNFWRISDHLKDFELAYSGRFQLQLARNEQGIRYLPVKDIPALTGSGVYVAVMRESGDYRYDYPATWFAVSDLGIHLRQYTEQLDATVNSLKTAEPLAGVRLQLLNSSGDELLSEVTTTAGTASFKGATELGNAALLIATIDTGDTSLVRLFGAGLDLAEFPVEGPVRSSEQLFMYSPRDLYRPGESVTVSGLLRDADGRAAAVLQNADGTPRQRIAELSLTRPDGQEVASRTLGFDDLGYLQGEWQIPADAATGEWTLAARINAEDSFSYHFQVEEFLPERMQLTLEAPEYISSGEPLRINALGEYLYGAPAKGNVLESELISQMAAHPFSRWQDVYFGHPNATEFNRRITLNPLSLGSQGQAVVRPDAFWQQAKVPLQLKVFHSLIDSGGRPVSRRSISYVLPAERLLGIRPLFADGTVDYDTMASFELIATSGNEDQLAAANVQVKLIREYRQYHWVYSEVTGWESDYTQREYPVFSDVIDLIAGSSSEVSAPVEWGYYRLEVTDPQTGLVSGYRFQAGWDPGATVMAGRPDRIGMALDKQVYAAGDEVKVAIQPPAAGKGFLLVESDQPLLRMPVDIPEEGSTVSFTLDPAWQRHDLYVSVLLIQPGEQREQALPRRMLGIAPLPLDREARRLSIQLDVPAKTYPNSQLSVPVQISTTKDMPETVSMTLAAVDVGVLNISRFATPDPFADFFGQRRYEVTGRDSYGDLIDAGSGEMATLSFGGDEDFNGAGEQGEDVRIVSLFSGPVSLSDEGYTEVVLDLPDFNGKLRLMAVAYSADDFGATEQDIEVAAPLVTQLTKPRFLAPGDISRLALDLHNLSGQDQQFELSLVLQGLRTGDAFSSDEYQQSLNLKVNEKRTLYIPVEAADINGLAQISLDIQGLQGLPAAQQQVLRDWYLSVRPAWAVQSLLEQRRLVPGEVWQMSPATAEDWLTSDLRSQLRVASLPPIDFTSHFNALRAYPYGCLEQTTSGVFPQLFVNSELIRRFGLPESTPQSRQQALQLAVSRVLGMQKYNGGFGLWNNESAEEHWLTVYVLDFLLRAQQAGYQVPAAGLNEAMQRVSEYLRSPSQLEYLSARSQFAVRAYAAQVLSQAEQASLADLRSLFDYQRGNAGFLGLIQLGLALDKSGDSNRGERALTAGLVAAMQPDYRYVSYGSKVRDLALAIFWLLEAERPSEYWIELLDNLQEQLGKRRWLSTQERNALFLAGQALVAKGEQPLDLTLLLGSEQVSLQAVEGYARSLQGEQAAAPLKIENTGTTDAYVSLRLNGRTATEPSAHNQGIQVQRRFYDADGVAFADQQNLQLQSGQQVLVELSVMADANRPHGLVVDLLPAGLELENQNLNDAYSISDLSVEGTRLADLLAGVEINHQEYRDDRFVAAVSLYADRPVRLFYLARAVVAGEFKLPPTFAEDMYQPEARHQGVAAGQLTVTPR